MFLPGIEPDLHKLTTYDRLPFDQRGIQHLNKGNKYLYIMTTHIARHTSACTPHGILIIKNAKGS